MSKARTLANLISDNAELADGQISVAEVVGAAPLASPTFTGDVTAPEIDLSAISATINDTALYIVVYDTSKDSDGGAWRKRTQHTSWYNETLSTSIRGSRKEFPAVAVIVAEADTVTIYDGDDPSMPMWMVWEQSGVLSWASGTTTTNIPIAALNGKFVWGTDQRGGGIADFIKDEIEIYHGTTEYELLDKKISSRATASFRTGNGYSIDHDNVYDVAIAVVPNAPIDAATGLPIPTIAIANSNGISVINNDGTVADSSYSNAFKKIVANKDGFAFSFRDFENFGVVSYDRVASDNWSADIANIYYGGSGGMSPLSTSHSSTNAIDALAEYSQGNNLGVTNWSLAETGTYNKLFNYTTSDYNTGWMNGDIKLATLSDTDDTNVTGSELNTDPNFDSGVGIFTAATGTVTHSSGTITSTKNSGGNSAMTSSAVLTIGKAYYIEFEVTATSPAYTHINSPIGEITSGQVGTHSGTFIAGSTTVDFGQNNGGTTSSVTFTRISIRLAEEDRSVNGNGLQVFGTVTKSAVATGADLVAYSGFDNGGTSYLEQPYNSGLDFSGDFCFIAWVYGGDADSAYPFSYGGPNGGGSDKLIFLRTLSSSYQFGTYDVSDGTNTITGPSVSNNWHCLCGLRRGGTVEFYHNGVLQGSYTRDYDFTGTSTHKVRVGLPPWNTGPFDVGSVSLARISQTAPSPEQIAKIYNDEKHLFQTGAQATLYGSSDAVTALAYDDSTDLLHVGTSAGRSVFQGLRRVDNTTDAVGAAISASNGLVAED